MKSISATRLATAAVQRILRALQETPGLSREQIADRAFVSKTTLSGGGYLKSMRESGQIHISGWRRNRSGSFSTPLFSAGGGKDYPRPKVSVHNREAPGMARVLEAIRDYGPVDYLEAARIAELSPNTVKNAGYLDALIAQRKIHVASWKRNRRGPMRAVYGFGPGEEAEQPLPLRRAEMARRRRMPSENSPGLFIQQLRTLAALNTAR